MLVSTKTNEGSGVFSFLVLFIFSLKKHYSFVQGKNVRFQMLFMQI